MAEMMSPGVYVTEIDASEIVPSVSSSTTVFGGDFTKGPVERYTEITSVDDLIEFYGLPTNDNYNDWYQCYNFLQYGSRLLVSRACNLNGYPIFTNSKFKGISSQEGYGTVDYGIFGYGDGIDDQKVLIDSNPGLVPGDVICFAQDANDPASVIDESKTERYLIVRIETVSDTHGHNIVAMKLDRDLELPPEALKTLEPTQSNIINFYTDRPIVVKLLEHHNGSCEALEYGNHTLLGENKDKPPYLTWKKSSIRFMKYESGASTGTYETNIVNYSVPVFIPNGLKGTNVVSQDDVDPKEGQGDNFFRITQRSTLNEDMGVLFKTNIKVLNPDDFDYKDTSGSIAFSTSKSKLKFMTRTPGIASSYYKIAICVPSDFASNDKAHTGNHCPRYVVPGIPVDNLFEYAPKTDSAQIAVVIYDEIAKEVKERYICSLDPEEKDSYNNSMFIEKVINRTSNIVYVKCNNATTEDSKKEIYPWVSDNGIGEWNPSPKPEMVPNVESYCLVADSEGNYFGVTLSPLDASDSPIQKDDLLSAYEVFENKDLIDVDIIISNELDNGISAKNLAETRQDCIAYLGIPYEYVENENLGILTVSKRSAEATSNIVRFRNATHYNTDRVSLVANYKYQYDRYNDTYRWINFAGDVAGLRARTSQDLEPWYASAGLNRGQLKNVTKLAYNPNQTQRNTLYTNGINPIVDFPGQGIVLWGQKTMLDKASSFDRVNVRCLFNTIERALAKMSKYQVMEFNDTFTRNRIIAIMKPYLASVQAGRGIQDFHIICDTSNNTPDVISRNQLVVDIYIKPTYVAEMIHLNFINAGTNDFSSVISTNNS